MVPVIFGDGVEGALFLPSGPKSKPRAGRWPVIVYLPPYTYARGYTHRFRLPFAPLLKAGFAVFGFDQIGFGTRMHEASRFYQRHPSWSRLGKMIADTRAALSALEALENVDPAHLYLLGYGLGGKVALFTAALDERPAAIASVAAFAPLRLQTTERGTEGLAHYAYVHGLVPRFGFFEGQEQRLPVDYDEILAIVSPRPALVMAPTRDRFAPVEDVTVAVRAARKVYELYGQGEALKMETPPAFAEFPPEAQAAVIAWLLGLQ
jgi:dienelactone hydrolase